MSAPATVILIHVQLVWNPSLLGYVPEVVTVILEDTSAIGFSVYIDHFSSIVIV